MLAVERVDDEARTHEEQRLEERVREQVEDASPVGREADADEHVGDLAHRGERDDALDVRLDDRNRTGHQEADDADDDDQVEHLWCVEEQRVHARDQVDARGHHRRGVDQGTNRSRALHRVGEPGVEWDLSRLCECTDEQQQTGNRGLCFAELVGRGEDAAVRDGAEVDEEQEDADRQANVTDGVHDEGLLGSLDGRRLVVPEANQQVRGESDEAPADQELHEVATDDEHQHREHEHVHVREEATLLRIALHVSDREDVDQEADARHDHQHQRRQLVEPDVKANAEIAG